ncbi:MAG: hypothetical protein KDK11_06800, partial [Maritimibacter sp.]|nr:hypothetical protein [Maritimibacter sp.]
SQLELDSDIQQVIARVEAARSQARDADARKTAAETEERRAVAEMDALGDAQEAATTEQDSAEMGDAGMVAAAAAPRTTLDAHV